MNKKTFVGALTVIMVLGMASMAFAGGDDVKAAGLWVLFGVAIACGIGIGLAALGTGVGMGNAINGALTGTARNPEAGGKIMTTMIIGLALIESLCIYALVICFILVGKIPSLEEMFKIAGLG
ncbi:MAG: ATP synthase F0 subunit C [Deltaproteobacteria bacterium]|nr:ATP synthase F0 subunit C [Deltaproteobacteria bacterium]MBW1924912.1 ATP synthase F0 subunit C [Deltaproteobacteria bacterium]MBW1949480.1 ATP synthase F0 subunit C [Deltaproteobacteria bacterium]MBW2007608.1 ATP synthase F0 subunit C [Deltaproteobacteria bacterium]MBW2103484.1 ATP synthase F0 subunit C [Deltaproteobacteria bacterium]